MTAKSLRPWPFSAPMDALMQGRFDVNRSWISAAFIVLALAALLAFGPAEMGLSPEDLR